LYWLGRAWLALTGWKVEGTPPRIPRAVIIAAPHTSNWDLPFMLAAAWVLRMHYSWMGKHTLFRGPMGPLLRWLGGIPVDRRAPKGQVQAVADMIQATDRIFLAVPPSGTRSKAAQWKSGFYWIAYAANVPIVCGYLDYPRRTAALGFTLVPSGNVKVDMDRIRSFYADVRGKYPDQETPILLKEELEDSERPGDA
jgi:1-acyl-sn-glycerol-3-phosphate acyltransferase